MKALTGGKIVNRKDVIAAPQMNFSDMRTDLTATPGYKDFHVILDLLIFAAWLNGLPGAVGDSYFLTLQ